MANNCPDCGEEHTPYSQKVLSLYRRYTTADSPAERNRLSEELSAALYNEHDPTDPGLTDDYHSYFEEYEQALQRYRRAHQRLTRLGVHVIEEYAQNHELNFDPPVETNQAN